MMEFAEIYVRSIVGITALTTAVCYLGLIDPIVMGGYMTAVVACVLLDKPEQV